MTTVYPILLSFSAQFTHIDRLRPTGLKGFESVDSGWVWGRGKEDFGKG